LKPRFRRKLTFLLGFGAYFTVLWLLWSSPVVYPLKVFVVLLHEVSHGMAALATGGTIQRIVLDPGQGGACHCPGGSAFLTLSAGYLGSLLWGTGLVLLAQARRIRPRIVVGVAGGTIVGLTALYLRGAFALGFGLAFGLGLAAAARWLPAGANRILLRALGLTSCLYAVLDIKSDVLERPHLPSDAAMLAELTGVPTLLWGTLWISLALAACGWLVHHTWRRA